MRAGYETLKVLKTFRVCGPTDGIAADGCADAEGEPLTHVSGMACGRLNRPLSRKGRRALRIADLGLRIVDWDGHRYTLIEFHVKVN